MGRCIHWAPSGGAHGGWASLGIGNQSFMDRSAALRSWWSKEGSRGLRVRHRASSGSNEAGCLPGWTYNFDVYSARVDCRGKIGTPDHKTRISEGEKSSGWFTHPNRWCNYTFPPRWFLHPKRVCGYTLLPSRTAQESAAVLQINSESFEFLS